VYQLKKVPRLSFRHCIRMGLDGSKVGGLTEHFVKQFCAGSYEGICVLLHRQYGGHLMFIGQPFLCVVRRYSHVLRIISW